MTCEILTHGTGLPTDASVDRVNNDAGYAAGNLAVMSVWANRAKSQYDWQDAARFARQIEMGRLGQIDGLTAGQWSRLAVLSSFCTPMSHAEAATLPLLMMPPPRLRVLNPAQVLQVLLTLRFMRKGQPARVDRIAGLFSQVQRGALQALMNTLLARRIEAGPCPSAVALQKVMEAAWAEPLLLRRWQSLALSMTAAQCQSIAERMVANGLAGRELRYLPLAKATEGWALETVGMVEAAESREITRTTCSASLAAQIDRHPSGSGLIKVAMG